MTYSLSNICSKNYWNWTTIVESTTSSFTVCIYGTATTKRLSVIGGSALHGSVVM